MSASDREGAGAASADAAAARDRAAEERRRHAMRDLAELAEQVANGELDESTAAELRAGYEAELAGLEDDAETEPAQSRSSRRAWAGALALIGVFTVVILIAAQTFRADGGGVAASPEEGASISDLEDILANHPDSPGMQLAVADAYFEQGDYSSAIGHYLDVLGKEPEPRDESHALGRVGWMAYITGQVEASEEYLNASLQVDSTNGESKLFLAMVLFEGRGDAAAAIPLFEEVLEIPGLRESVRQAVERVLDEARSTQEAP